MHVDHPAERCGPRRMRRMRRMRLATVLLSATAIAAGATAAIVTAGATSAPTTSQENTDALRYAASSSEVSSEVSSSGPPTQTPIPTPTPTTTPTALYDTAASPCSLSAVACVDIGAKKAWLQDADGVTRGPVPIETGQPGHLTPTGVFHVSWKADYTESTIYGLPMPHAVFFAAGGIAFHEGPLDSPSHGCVHLTAADATAFFAALNRGDEVDVW